MATDNLSQCRRFKCRLESAVFFFHIGVVNPMSPPPSATAHAGLQRMGSSSSTFTTTNSLIKICRDHKGGINWMSLSPDGCNLLTASEDCTARLWRTSDNQCCRLLQGESAPLLHQFENKWPLAWLLLVVNCIDYLQSLETYQERNGRLLAIGSQNNMYIYCIQFMYIHSLWMHIDTKPWHYIS